MAENEMVTTKDGVWRIDVDTFIPEPDGYIKVKGIEYPIYSFLDIEIDDSFKVARLGTDISKAETYEDRLDRSIDQILLLNAPAILAGKPVLTKELFKRVSPKAIITLTVLASTIAQVPLKTDPGTTESSASNVNSPSPSPESVASSDGGERISSPSA